MSATRTHAAFENNFVSIFDKYDPKKIKNFTREWSDDFSKMIIVKFKWQRNLMANLNK